MVSYGICFSLLLQMAIFHSFYGLLLLCCRCVYHIFSIHLSVSRHIGCFQVLVTVNNTAINMGVHASFWIRVLSRYMPQVLFKEPPYCSPWWLYQCTLPQTVLEGSLFSTPSPKSSFYRRFTDGHSEGVWFAFL